MDAVVATAQNAGLALTWPEFRLRCLDLARKIDFSPFDSIFAVPTSGVCVGVELSSFSGLPLVWEPTEKTLVVDDVCDSGRTFERWSNAPIRAALFDKGRAPRSVAPNYVGETVSGWVAFPWETTKKIESTVVRQLEFLGENPNREGLRETPERVRKSWATLYGGYGENPKEILSKRFSVDRLERRRILLDVRTSYAAVFRRNFGRLFARFARRRRFEVGAARRLFRSTLADSGAARRGNRVGDSRGVGAARRLRSGRSAAFLYGRARRSKAARENGNRRDARRCGNDTTRCRSRLIREKQNDDKTSKQNESARRAGRKLRAFFYRLVSLGGSRARAEARVKSASAGVKNGRNAALFL